MNTVHRRRGKKQAERRDGAHGGGNSHHATRVTGLPETKKVKSYDYAYHLQEVSPVAVPWQDGDCNGNDRNLKQHSDQIGRSSNILL